MKADNAVEWFKEHGGILTVNRSPASKEAREAWGAKYADVIIEQVGTAVTIEQAERYAREFAAEQFETLRDWFLNNGATNLVSRAWVAEKLDERIAELKG